MHYNISTDPLAHERIDKWLWAARFFKTRTLAADALGKGHVRVGDFVEIEMEHVVWQVKVLGLCNVRGPANIAQTLYAETADSRVRRMAELERRRVFHEPAATLHGRPTKRNRRVMERISRG